MIEAYMLSAQDRKVSVQKIVHWQATATALNSIILTLLDPFWFARLI